MGAIVAIGEALWDIFPDGRRPGGAPCNVAFHATQLGNEGTIITRVGNDESGDTLTKFLRDRGVATQFVQVDAHRPTGTVIVSDVGSEPHYTISEDVAWDNIVAEHEACMHVQSADVICVGSLAQRSRVSRASIRELMSHAGSRSKIIFDVNLRPPFVDPHVIRDTLAMAGIVKLNDTEVAYLADTFDQPSVVEWLLADVGVQTVCVTRGEEGASVSTREGTASFPGIEIDVSRGDSVGAGDAFTAAIAHGLVRNDSSLDAVDLANRYAALIASEKGAMPVVSVDKLERIGVNVQ